MVQKLPMTAINEALNSYAISSDSDGIYTLVEYKRKDGTLYMRSTLKNRTNGLYLQMSWDFYDAAGTTLLYTQNWTLVYDGKGNIISKVVS